MNQIFIFGACFYPACIVAALPHIALVTFLFLYFFGEEEKDFSLKEDEDIIIPIVRSKQLKRRETNELKKLLKELQNSEPLVEKERDLLKVKGDKFEKYIGKKFEDKGELVIYNGFIRGYEDKGVDVISLCPQTKSINLVQCKNWTRKSMFLDDIKNIHTKLSEYDFDFCNLSSKKVNQYLQLKKDNNSIETILQGTSKNLKKYTIRKTWFLLKNYG